jgi:hypothetical protein
MVTKARALGRIFDIGVGAMPQSFNGSGITGKPISLQNCEGVTILVVKSANGTTDDFAVDLQEVNLAGGTPRDLDIITDYYVKSETALDNDEAWVKTTQAAASEITAIAGTAELQMLVVIEVRADQLSDGYTHVALNVPDLGNTDTEQGCVIYIPWGLKVQRAPENMPSLLTPGTANA